MKPSRLALIVIVAACARQATPSRGAATPSPAGVGHDMAAMNHEMDMHAAASAGSHSAAELAFLFPDGND